MLDEIEGKLRQDFESETKVLVYDTNGLDSDLVMFKVSEDLENLGLTLEL